MAQAGIEEVGIIIAPETGGEIERAAGDGSRFGISITYIEQAEPLGLAHAVLTAEPFLGEHPFVMYLGDNLLQGGISDLVAAFREHSPDALILLTPVPDPENYGVAELADAPQGEVGRVMRLVEKPSEPATDLALVGVYMFTPGIHDAARAIEPSARGELEITDAIQHLVDSGLRVEPHIVRGWWKDTGRLEDMLEANRLILDNLVGSQEGELIDSQIDGRVAIAPGARLERTTVRGPAVIGAGAQLRDCYIGPYTAIGEGCTVSGRRGRALHLACRVLGLRPRRAYGVLAAWAQRHRATRRAPAEGLPLHGRGQLGHLDPVSARHDDPSVLTAGACGRSSARDARVRCCAGEHAGHELHAHRPARARHHRPGCRGRVLRAQPARCGDQLRRLDATWTAPRPTPDAARAVNAVGAGLSPLQRHASVRPSCMSRPTTYSPGRLRLTPPESRGPTSSPIPPDRSPSTARPSSQASWRCWRPRRGTQSCAAPGCLGSTGATSPTRCSSSPRTRRACR